MMIAVPQQESAEASGTTSRKESEESEEIIALLDEDEETALSIVSPHTASRRAKLVKLGISTLLLVCLVPAIIYIATTTRSSPGKPSRYVQKKKKNVHKIFCLLSKHLGVLSTSVA